MDALRRNTTVFLRRNGSRFSGLLFQDGNRVVSIEYDHLAQAEAAMRWAAKATCERERLEWLRIAFAWYNLTLVQQHRFHEAPHHRFDSVHDD